MADPVGEIFVPSKNGVDLVPTTLSLNCCLLDGYVAECQAMVMAIIADGDGDRQGDGWQYG